MLLSSRKKWTQARSRRMTCPIYTIITAVVLPGWISPHVLISCFRSNFSAFSVQREFCFHGAMHNDLLKHASIRMACTKCIGLCKTQCVDTLDTPCANEWCVGGGCILPKLCNCFCQQNYLNEWMGPFWHIFTQIYWFLLNAWDRHTSSSIQSAVLFLPEPLHIVRFSLAMKLTYNDDKASQLTFRIKKLIISVCTFKFSRLFWSSKAPCPFFCRKSIFWFWAIFLARIIICICICVDICIDTYISHTLD